MWALERKKGSEKFSLNSDILFFPPIISYYKVPMCYNFLFFFSVYFLYSYKILSYYFQFCELSFHSAHFQNSVPESRCVVVSTRERLKAGISNVIS